MVVKGTFDTRIFKSPDSGYSIFIIKTSDTNIPLKARNNKKNEDKFIRFTAVGNGLPETNAVDLTLSGDWETSRYGCQLKVETWDIVEPRTKQGIRDYLSCGIFKGLSRQTATDIVNRFGLDTLRVIENQPQQLARIPGVNQDVLSVIRASHNKGQDMKKLEDFFTPFGISSKEAKKVYEHFGPGCLQHIKESPFELCRVSGFGLKRVDNIARALNRPPNDPLRIKAAASLVLEKYSARGGHLYLMLDVLCKKTLATLNSGVQEKTRLLAIGEVATALNVLTERKELIAEDGCIYLPRHHRNELFVARRVAAMLGTPSCGADIQFALERAKQKLAIKPSESQEAAVIMAFQHNISIMTGLPGTGKTTVLKLIIAVYKMLYPDNVIALSAPTGRASRHMAESTGFAEAKTMHSLMGLQNSDGDDVKNASREPMEADFIIIDETSMVDMWLAKELFARIKPGAALFLVGDAGQLPSVGAGNVFHELITCGLIQVTELTQIFRQAEDSLIVQNARRINAGETPLVTGEDFFWEEFLCAQDAVDYLVECYLQEIAEHGVEDVQILSPYATDGIASAEKLNLLVRDMVNPANGGKPEVRIGKKLFREKDRVMQTKNQNNVSNGEIGFISKIRDPDGAGISIVIQFSGNRVVEYLPSELGIIELSYAVTTHKAMGSEFSFVLMPVLADHAGLLDKRMLNTAITRARLRCYLAGHSHALTNAIRNDKSSNRSSRLGFQIKRQYLRLLEANAPPVPGRCEGQLQFTG